MEYLLLTVAIVVLVYALVSAVVPRTILTAPILLVASGASIADVIHVDAEHKYELLERIAELTLVVLLFTDASRINGRCLAREFSLPLRMLCIGLPTTIGAGILVGILLFPEFSLWEIALLAAILAPTDAALGQAVVSSKQVPLRIRQALNVESGLNDGIAVPFVMLFAALAATNPGTLETGNWVEFVGAQITLGPIAGIVVGLAGGRIIEAAATHGWVDESFRKLSGVALAVLAWAGATSIGGNGFIAAFVCGLAVGTSTLIIKPAIQEFGETEGQLLSLVSFLLFGAFFAIETIEDATPVHWLYAVCSLTFVRMLPVAISLVGTKIRLATTVFLGWFGPRGLASLIFALLVTREHAFEHSQELFNIAMLTAILSILVHGLTAVPGAKLYARVVNARSGHRGEEHEPCQDFPLRYRDIPCVIPDVPTSDE